MGKWANEQHTLSSVQVKDWLALVVGGLRALCGCSVLACGLDFWTTPKAIRFACAFGVKCDLNSGLLVSPDLFFSFSSFYSSILLHLTLFLMVPTSPVSRHHLEILPEP